MKQPGIDELKKITTQSLSHRRRRNSPLAVSFSASVHNTVNKLAELLLIGALLLLSSTRAVAAPNSQSLHGQVPAAVKEFGLKATGRLQGTDQLHLAIGLPLRNPGDLARLLAQIYDPGSRQYRHY